jgi:hypothetical protein
MRRPSLSRPRVFLPLRGRSPHLGVIFNLNEAPGQEHLIAATPTARRCRLQAVKALLNVRLPAAPIIEPPAQISSTCNRRRSQPLSLLSMARLKRARSRPRCSSCSRTRIAQTSFGLSGRFCPVRWPLFQGTVCMIASIEPTTPSAAPADWQAGQSIGTTGVGTSSDVRSGHARLPGTTQKRPS